MYFVEFSRDAEKDISKIDKAIAQRILSKVKWLSENFDYITPQTLKGQFQKFYKSRVGDYRILYTVHQENKKLVVHLIGHRREIYKQNQ